MIRTVGLTGGIGSGKSTVAGMFAELGVPAFDLDRAGAEVVAPGSEGIARIIAEFGTGFLLPDGSLDRGKLAAHCFSDPGRTQQLNDLLHPLIWETANVWLAQQSTRYAVIEASVLIESGGIDRIDELIVVMADLETRWQRIRSRENMSRGLFENIVARQCDDAERLQLADYVLRNDGSLDELRRQVLTLYETLRRD